MQAETLNCPMCGAPQATDATCCDHCGARLATVACPSCFGLIFEGSKFCSHCGAKVERAEVASDAVMNCPRCRAPMGAITLSGSNLLECGKCEGLWLDNATFEQICADREKQVAVLGMPGALPVPEPDTSEAVHYLPCPVCKNLMNRVNFAHCSHVIVNVCTKHGTWFDKDELRKIVEFIRAGGMEKAREREITELQQERSLADFARVGNAASVTDFSTGPRRYDGFDLAFGAIGAALKHFLK